MSPTTARPLLSSRFTAVLFDLDDTLLNTFQARVAALQDVFNAAGIREPTAEAFVLQMRGRQLEGALEALKRQAGTNYDLFTHYRRAYWLQNNRVAPFPGVRETLERLRSAGLKLGVVTQKERLFQVDGRPAGAALELAHSGLAEFFSATLGYEDVTHHKPDPEAIRVALSRLSVSPAQTLVVGDSAADLLAGQAAGCRTCHATWGLPAGAASLDGARPHFVVDRPEAILRLVRQ